MELNSNQQRDDSFVIENNIIKGNEHKYPVTSKNIAEYLFKILNRTPQQVIQIDAITGQKKTFKDLKDRCIRLAVWLRKQGIGPEHVVSLCSPNHLDIDTIIFAIIFVGATYNVFPHDLNLELARRFINYVNPRVIFTYKNKVDVLQEAVALENHPCKIIVLGDDRNHESFDDILNAQSADEIENFQLTAELNPEHMISIMPTSGTSGESKFVCFTYGSYMRWIETIASDSAMKNTKLISLVYLYPEWEIHCRCLLYYFVLGHTRICHLDFEPHEICRIIEKYKVNVITFTTYLASIICSADLVDKYDLQSVSLVAPIGSKLFTKVEKGLQKYFQKAFIQKSFGLTETCCLTNSTTECRNPQSVGTVIPNVQVKISDFETGLPVGMHKVGEICTKTPWTTSGYYKNPTATKLIFDDEGWFRTGDEGYYDENGELLIVGRLKEMIRFRDTDVHPLYVEQILLSHPNIADAAVVGIDHDVDVEHPVAFIKKAPGSNVTEKDILKLTCELEYSDTFENSVIFVDDIPRSTNGKIKKRVLRELATKIFKTHSNNF